MNDELRSLEACKLIKEWAVWVVTIQVGALAFLGSSIGKLSSPFLMPALVCFGISILAAAWVLGAIPWIVLNVTKNPYMERLSSFPVLNKIKLWVMALAEHAFFAFGLICLGIHIATGVRCG